MRRRDGLTPAGEVVGSVLKGLGLQHELRQQQAGLLWPEIVGEQIAKATIVEKVWEGTVYVACRTSAWANELMLHRNIIMERLAERVGEGVIKDMRFSGRGFRGASREKVEDTEVEKGFHDTELAPGDIEEVEEIASAVEDQQLAELIRKALLSARSRPR